MLPTGREGEWKMIDVHRVEGGKIAAEWKTLSPVEDWQQERLEQEMRERERVAKELQVATRDIQQASLPKEVPTLEGWQINPYCQPAREVGGDFYDFALRAARGHPSGFSRSRMCSHLMAIRSAVMLEGFLV
jgi:hypothetical protein